MRDAPATFLVSRKILPYLRAFNTDIAYTESSVTIPVALRLYNQIASGGIDSSKDGKILELGAVLPHQHPRWIDPEIGDQKRRSIFPHICIDPHTDIPGVIRQDILPYVSKSGKKLDLILSIDQIPRLMAESNIGDQIDIFRHLVLTLKSYLTLKGLMMMTIPYGLAHTSSRMIWMDEYIENLREMLTADNEGEGKQIRASDPDVVWKMNRCGYGMGGNIWREVDPVKSPDKPLDPSTMTVRTVYFLFWGNLWGNWK